MIVLLFTVLALPVYAVQGGLRITYDMSGTPLTIARDAAGTYQIDGLPYPGNVLYQPSTGTIYYQHPEDPVWHTVTPQMLQANMVLTPASASAGNAWQPWQGQPTKRWNISIGGTQCQPLFTSQGAEQQMGLTVNDFARILGALEWLSSGTAPSGCEAPLFTQQQAVQMGAPVWLGTANGPWQLQTVTQEDIPAIQLPTNATPVDNDIRLRLLLVQFSPNERAELLKKFGDYPVAEQIEAIGKFLNQEAMP